MKYILSMLVVVLWLFTGHISAKIPTLRFRSLTALDRLPTNYVRCLYQDKEGYIWIGTENGLFVYDGYQVVPIKKTGGGLPDNQILCLEEDDSHRLWVGTRMGLAVINKVDGSIRRINQRELNNSFIQQLVFTADGQLWVGANSGLFRYDEKQDTFINLWRSKANEAFRLQGNVTTLLEDPDGFIWIGTWDDGLSCYDCKNERFITFPQLDSSLNVSALHLDREGRLWVGEWEQGLILMEHPYVEGSPCRRFRQEKGDRNSLSDDCIYAIAEDGHTGDLWFGTQSGLSILRRGNDGKQRFENYFPGESERHPSYNEIYAVLPDREGNMWLGMYGGGINFVSTSQALDEMKLFKPRSEGRNTSNVIESILVDNDNLLWYGIGAKGLVVQDRDTGLPFQDKALKRLWDLQTNIRCIVQSPTDGKIWLGTFGKGVWIYDKKAPEAERLEIWDWERHSWIGSVVNDILEDSRGNHWFASNTGLSVMDKSGQECYSFASLNLNGVPGNDYRFCQLTEDNRGRIWAASDNYGIVRVNGLVNDSVPDFSFYQPVNHRLETSDVSCVFQDSRNRIWAASRTAFSSIRKPTIAFSWSVRR